MEGATLLRDARVYVHWRFLDVLGYAVMALAIFYQLIAWFLYELRLEPPRLFVRKRAYQPP